ncbi:DUF3800 domain-containing protein [Marilutibacter maris]|uniref:DUF3800 domain-containing protein n=1 Tax=Marilutibacter maris TaxID=1605891 RepID=UPI000DA9F36F|nr:DUF3800 domain-containing protein [Lysobacter maris]
MRHVFIDESSQNDHHYMVLGALVLPGSGVAPATQMVEDVLTVHRMSNSEFKWSKVSRGKADAYRAIINLYFDEFAPRGAEFHALVIDNHELDHRGYNNGDPDLGFNKFLFSLLRHRVGRRFGCTERIVVDLDARNTSRHPDELQRVLNSAMGRDLGDFHIAPFSRIAHRDSRNTRLLQLADLLAGAVAWHKNDHDAHPHASPAKVALANHIANRVGLSRIGLDSPKSETRLSVWNHALKRRGAR